MVDQQWAVFFGAKPTNIYPLPEHINWYNSGLNDPGGAEFQSEPMMEFMRYNIRTANSPYWNPFSAAGSLGPETLIDLKFSLFTLTYAVLGGGALLFNWMTLFGYWLGALLIIRLCERWMGLSWIAGAAGGIFFVLNGFSIANVASNVAQGYLIVPWCLYACFAYVNERSWFRFAVMTLVFAAYLSFTFLPTMLVGLIAIGVCSAGYALSLRDSATSFRSIARPLFGVVGSVGGAIVCLSFIYLPIFEHLVSTSYLTRYADRVFFPASMAAVLSLFTPSHFFESYMAGTSALPISRNTVFHYGVVGLGLASLAVSRGTTHLRPLVICTALCTLIVFCRAFNVYGITQIIETIPLIRNFGEQYVWVAASISLMLLVALGTDGLVKGDYSRAPFIVLSTIVLASSLYLSFTLGLQSPNLSFKTHSLAALAAFGLIFPILTSPRLKFAFPVKAGVLVILMLVELIADAKIARYPAPDIFRNPTSDVAFLQSQAGLSRTMTFGAYATTAEFPSAFQIQEVTSLNFAPIESYKTYFNEMTRGLPTSYRSGDFLSLAYPQSVQRLDYFDWQKVNLLGIRYIVQVSTSHDYLRELTEKGLPIVHVSKFTTIVENTQAFPRAFLMDDPDVKSLQIDLPQALNAADVTPVDIAKYRNAQVTLRGEAARPSTVILTDNWHKNWSATLNGRAVEIAVVEGTFRGIHVPAGAFEIEMSYAPKTLPLALFLSTSCLLLMMTLVLHGFLRAPPKALP